MYRKYEYIFISFSSLPLVRKCNMTLKHPDTSVVTSSAESPAVGNLWKQEHCGVSCELPLHRKGGGESVHLTEGSRSEPSPAVEKVPNLQHEHRLPLADVTSPVTALQWMDSALCMCPSSASTFNLHRMQIHPLAFSNALAYAHMVWLTSINLWRGRG